MKPIYKITVNGVDIDFGKRLISLSVTDESGVKSDKCEITLSDRDSNIAVPNTGCTDLSTVYPTDTTARPSFKQHTIENHVTFRSNGKSRIKGGLHYIEHGSSDFENLDTSNGNINVGSGKSMRISGNMTGQVGSMSLGDNSAFLVDRIGFSQLHNFTVGNGSSFHSPNTYNINVNGSFTNSGEITSGADMSLYLKNVPTPRQSGIVLARGNLNYTHEQSNRPRNSTKAPDITKDPIARAQLLRTAPDPNSAAFKRLQEEFYRRRGYNPDADNSGSENPLKLLAKKIRQTIYTDHYLNTITYHYTITKDQYGREVSRVLTDVTETGYIWQKRTQESRDITVPISAELNQILDRKGQSIPGFKKAQDARTKLAQELERATAGARKAQMYQRFLEALRKAMTGAGASDTDVQAIMGDTYFNALMSWDNTPEPEQARMIKEYPETIDLAEAIDDARYDVHDLTRWMDDPVRRFVDDYVIPMMTIASCFIPGTQAVTVPRALAVAVPRIVPLLGRVATAYEVEEAYRRVTTFFNENFSGGKDKGTADTSSARRGTSGYGSGKFWSGLKSVYDPTVKQVFASLKKQAFSGGQIRTDGTSLFKFDKAHQSGKIHLEVYEKIRNNVFKCVREVDAETGETIVGGIAKCAKKKLVTW
jgi:hypothetical protein